MAQPMTDSNALLQACNEKREFDLSKCEFEQMKQELENNHAGVERVKKLEWELSTAREEVANLKIAKAVDFGKLATARAHTLEVENKGLLERLALMDTEIDSEAAHRVVLEDEVRAMLAEDDEEPGPSKREEEVVDYGDSGDDEKPAGGDADGDSKA
ncbi:hypothetical protein L1987_47168 [Smallanthus sonchifolius]|uniref:Uncharacterized protein n=1 Tax=Smallanthus sonchifolius TaxID=185202 RepID=A0ACB9G1N5_9ASTR|nr:hypothetical protein L1987_47168 [Smallanthus sonchifolius]